MDLGTGGEVLARGRNGGADLQARERLSKEARAVVSSSLPPRAGGAGETQ